MMPVASLAAMFALPLAPTADADLLSLKTSTATLTIGANGFLSSIRRNVDGRDFLAKGQPAPLLQMRVSGQWLLPSRAQWNSTTKTLMLDFGASGGAVKIRPTAKRSHVVFEVLETQPKGAVELVWWGPYPITINGQVGEVVGVVRDAEFAVGIQALNAKTLGGAPGEENDIGIDGQGLDDPGHYPDLPVELNKDQLFRGNTAWPTSFGSILQAFCRDRSRERVFANWGHDKFVGLPLDDGGVVGSKIALFACPAEDALKTLGQIEVAEGLPHPMLDGVWAKEAPQANSAYLIVDFGESTIDRAIAMTKAAGLRYLYHSSPFETWGHFKLKADLFPNGEAGLRACVQTAKKAGVYVGLHTLSNFVTPNDPYVTPKPDPRLARIGSSRLTESIRAGATSITVASPEFFAKKTDLNTVVIGDELIRYESVSIEAPWMLLGCQRGAWGTKASAHPQGEPVGKLMDHPYNVFLTDAGLSQEMAENLGRLCSNAGISQISLDGLEGNWSTGLGQYGRVLFTQAWWNALSPAVRSRARNDASNPAHFNWHINTYYNWGEPWYAGFRESQTIYRFKNQLFYTRNLLPRMLGWFALRPETTLADAEWLLARSAGYDAGFALASSLASTAQLAAASADADPESKDLGAILEAVKQWETARMARAFPDEVKAMLRDNSREFHLEPVREGVWDLFPLENGTRGEPVRLVAPRADPDRK